MLTLENVHLSRGTFTLDADFSIDAPGRVAVVGPSGGGKSTLFALIAGFERPDRGRIVWQEQDITDAEPGQRPVAVLFQDNNLFPHLDILSNVALGGSPRARPSAEVLDRARQALAKVGLSGYEARKPGGLSGGQQSRAALARVLLTDRRIVLMDEAFSALGPALRSEMLALVKELLPNALILMITHDPGDAKRWSEQTIFIDEGKVHPPAPTAELFANPPEALSRYLH